MYLINITNEEKIKLHEEVMNNPYSFSIYNALKDNKKDLILKLDKHSLDLIYSILIGDNYLEIIIKPDKTYSLKSGQEDTINEYLLKGIVLFILNSDISLNEEELEKKYGYIYTLIKDIAKLSKEDLAYYYSNKALYENLKQSIRIDSKNTINAKFKTLILDESFLELKNEKDIRIRYIDEFNQTLETSLYLFYKSYEDNDAEINRYSFSKEDQLFLSELKECYFLATRDNYNRYHSNFDAKYLNKILDVFEFYPRHHIYIKNKVYRVNHEIRKAKTYISSDCKIVSNINRDKIIYTNGLLSLCYEKETNTLYLVKYKNIQEQILNKFLFEHLEFPYSLYKSEFASNIIPYLNKSIDVADEMLSKSREFISEIQYYVDLKDDNKEDIHLDIYSKFLLNGLYVSEEIYKEETSNNDYKDFDLIITQLALPKYANIKDEQQIYEILSCDISKLNSCCRLFLSDNLKKIKVNSKISYRAITTSGIDWFKVSIKSDEFTDDELLEIVKAYKDNKKYIRFKDSIFSLKQLDNNDKLSILDNFDIDETLEGKKMPIYQAMKLKAFSSHDIQLSLSSSLKELFNNLKDYQNSDYKIETTAPLREYQLDAVKWMMTLFKYNLSGILADDMGLGKSLELITFLDNYKFSKPILIVSPKSLIYNWENEFKKWNSNKKTYVIDSSKEERILEYQNIAKVSNSVFIISYDSLRNDIEEFLKYEFSFLILDEGQYIANAFAKKTVAVKMIKADNKFVLTGTPIQNSLLDLWSLFDFILPGYFSNYKDFAKEYNEIDKEEIENNKNKLSLLIEPFILRRKKEDVLTELPSKEKHDIFITLDEESNKIYQAFLTKARNNFLKKSNNKIETLADITRLRQICIDPSSFLDTYTGISNKIETTMEIINNLIAGEHKVIIFSAFVTVLNHLEKLLEDNNIKYGKIIGDTKAKDRLDLTDKFNYEDDIKVVLISLKAGGTGLNLIGADNVILLDPWWNEASENQASDRAYRIGQNKNVTIMRLVSKNTIEERILELQKKKTQLNKIIHDSTNSFSSYSDDDILFLLGE